MKIPSEVIEQLAIAEHDRWANWMQYLFTKGMHNGDGSFTINAESVKRWQRQMKTHYNDLTRWEQSSDIKEVIKTLEVLIRLEEQEVITLKTSASISTAYATAYYAGGIETSDVTSPAELRAIADAIEEHKNDDA